MFNARIVVTLKNGVLDPQGKAIEGSLDALGFDGISSVRQGKVFEVELDASSKAAAEKQCTAMSEKLLANGVIEDFAVEIG
ncbi:MAG: phosphoribosylformylglycinamidine synthase subunit PurS [Pseudomonadota bacterium]